MASRNPAHPAFTTSIPARTLPLHARRQSLSPRRPRARRALRTPRCKASNPNKVLSKPELAEWAEISHMLRAINPDLSDADADKIVARAFGWGSQKFWRGDVKQEKPSLQQAQSAVQFLRDEIGLDEPAVAAVIKKFPEVIRLTIDKMTDNVATIQKNYPNLKGALLINSVKATPAVLGFDFDCEGDCKSECARCWVQF